MRQANTDNRRDKGQKPAGGLGAVIEGLKHVKAQKRITTTVRSMLKLNQPGGFDCPGCAWPEPDKPGTFEFCEQGMKHVAWEATGKRVDPDFFARHSVSELRARDDHWLESQGRLTHPMQYNAETDHYEPVSWAHAFKLIGATLQSLSPDEAIFYTSGRASNEAAFLYQLFARLHGTNNLPDCSNMCHESSGVALGQQLGTGKGTVRLSDFDEADAIFLIGQNPGSNHPRMMTSLERAAKRGARIVSFNPLRERGLERFQHPQHKMDVILGRSTAITELYLRPIVGGDLAAMKGLIKCLLEAEQAKPGRVLDHAFIEQHTIGFDDLKADIERTSWDQIEAGSGLGRGELKQAADLYMGAERTIICWAMGLTQHKHAVATIQMIINVLLLRGQFGKAGAGACPVRGHSNVQGDRTVGITEQPGETFLANLGQAFGFEPPAEHGYDTVHAIRAMAEGRARCFIALGGNFAAATPDFDHTAPALEQCALTAQISTKLNRSHLVHGKQALILPCLTRNELDMQANGPQKVTVEDSMSQVHASAGQNRPISDELRSEPAIVAEMAKAALAGTPREALVDWDALVADYGRIRERIAAVLPEFADFNEKIERPGGFYLGNPARDRQWRTPAGKAQFMTHPMPDLALPAGQLRLTTIRSHDQFNTTIYGYDDRYRDVHGTRQVIFMNEADLADRGLADGDAVTITSHYDGDRTARTARGFRARAYDIPRGCAAGYFPELNVLASAEDFADGSHTPNTKSIPITVQKG